VRHYWVDEQSPVIFILSRGESKLLLIILKRAFQSQKQNMPSAFGASRLTTIVAIFLDWKTAKKIGFASKVNLLI